MKEHICQLPTLATPMMGKTLTIYLSASLSAISAVLMVDRHKKQVPIYFLSRTLKGPEERYLPIEKLALALLYASRRLRRYFQEHPIRVITESPIQKILEKPKISVRMAKWAIELGDHTIEYVPRTAVKGQVLADFMTKTYEKIENESEKGWEREENEEVRKPWKLFTDGAVNDEGCGAGLMLTSPEGVELTYALRLEFQTTNNEAEYEALLAGLRLAKKMGEEHLEAHVDSLLVTNQVNGVYNAKEESMIKYLGKVQEMLKAFKTKTVTHIPRGQNREVDVLSKLASITFQHLAKEVKVETLNAPSISATEVMIAQVSEIESWMTPLVNYMVKGALPEEKHEARRIKIKALQYEMIDRMLYRKSYLGPSLKCVDEDEANYITRELHEGICGIHTKPKVMVAKAMKAGYYWPGMYRSMVELLRTCDNCQIHAPVTKQPKFYVVVVNSAWPFQRWGIVLMGPFPEEPGKVKFLVVAIDYFTKWIEAKLWKPSHVNRWSNSSGTTLCAAHPQANVRVERANRSIVEGIRNRLGREKNGWIDVLPNVLWAYRTTSHSGSKETPFSLTYGTEAMIPVEIGAPTRRTAKEAEENEEELSLNLNLFEERRKIVLIKEAAYKKQMEKYYNARVIKTDLWVGYWALQANEASGSKDRGKPGPRWEGPYKVAWTNEKGTYKLVQVDEKEAREPGMP
ncbi:hypothetical protein L1987_53318 [Smallanthus sonchifolius]|uniref:Uncharacterized protein n=1 Tax=Smallanthus sonchifolius TaxID=185202 RepID=A0ACB9EW04_9ASTR|nr:hypothetical protein L1987_53318 [Smallanthus sonchifolius]